MRLLPILTILVAAVVIAGCAKKDDTGGTTTPTPTPSTPKTTPTATPTTSTPSGTTPTSPTTPTTPTTPTPVAPMALCTGKSYDFSGNQPDPGNPGSFTTGKTDCGTTAAGYTNAAMTVNWTDSAGNPFPPGTAPDIALTQSVDVKLIDSAKKAVATCTLAGGPITNPTKCQGSLTGAGDYQLLFEGSGAVKATVTVNVS